MRARLGLSAAISLSDSWGLSEVGVLIGRVGIPPQTHKTPTSLKLARCPVEGLLGFAGGEDYWVGNVYNF